MIVVGLTGGIGSGKSTVAGFFKEKGVSVYTADDQAKKIMTTNQALKLEIIKLFGKEAYQNEILNRPYIASQVFGNKNKLTALNALVHPAVRKDFNDWRSHQKSPYILKEAAILFENGGYKYCDFTILVRAPLEERMRRIQSRDGSTREQILARMNAQWKDYQKVLLSDCIIDNIDLEKTKLEVARVHKHLLRRIANTWN